MTENKSLKRRVRARMAKTGERYTAARRVLAKPPGEPPSPPSRPLPPKNDVVLDRTGRGWAEWFDLLDDWGAADRPHGEIARFLNVDLGVDGWWSQNVTVEYERAIGRRQLNQRVDGSFVATASKTLGVPIEVAFDAFADEAMRARWLSDVPLKLRRATPHKTIRFDWASDSSRVQVSFDRKGEGRCLVALEHQRLAGPEVVGERKAYWKEHLERLQNVLEGPPGSTAG